jgi:hypothetical protein
VTDIDLDFSHMRDHMRRILSGEISVFTLSSSNAMVQVQPAAAPSPSHTAAARTSGTPARQGLPIAALPTPPPAHAHTLATSAPPHTPPHPLP